MSSSSSASLPPSGTKPKVKSPKSSKLQKDASLSKEKELKKPKSKAKTLSASKEPKDTVDASADSTEDMVQYLHELQLERRNREQKVYDALVAKLYGSSTNRISAELVSQRCLTETQLSMSGDAIADALLQVTHLRLDRLGISMMENLELYSNCTHLYLQSNSISRIEGLEFMPNLRFLVLARNRIQKVENVIFLENLQYLDLSDNAIDELDVDELPDQALAYVSFAGNACAEKEQYRSQLVGHLPLLREIDGRAVTVSEKREFDLDGGVATDEDDDDEDDDSQQEEDEQEEAVKAEDRIKSAEEVREEIEDMYAAAFDRMRAKRDEMIIRAGAEKAAVDAEFAKRLKTVDEARAFLESVQQEQQKPAPPA